MPRERKPGMVEKAFTFRDRVGAWCATLACLGAGYVLWIGPEEIKEEISYHQEIGAGFGAFGAIMFLALILRGQAGYRIRCLALAFLAILVGGALSWWIEGTALDIKALKETGEYRQVEVVGTQRKYNPQSRKSTILTNVNLDGKVVSVKLAQATRRGQRVSVLTSISRPSAIVDGRVEKTWLALTDEIIGRWIALIVVILALFCILSIPRLLWRVLVGAPTGEDPDRDRL